jgi:hypothetical protein
MSRSRNASPPRRDTINSTTVKVDSGTATPLTYAEQLFCVPNYVSDAAGVTAYSSSEFRIEG